MSLSSENPLSKPIPRRRAIAALAVASLGLACGVDAAPADPAEGAGGSTPRDLYVSPSGDDAWSGTQPAPNRQRADGPFRTLTRARDELRKRRQAGQSGGATVWVRGGSYFFTETLAFTEADSGTKESPVVFRAYRDEKPILIGGAQVTGFKPYKGKIVQADLKALGLGGITFKQLFCDGKRQILARYPNFDPENPYAGGFLYVAAQPDAESKTSFVAPPGSIHVWKNPAEGEIWGFPGVNYWNDIKPIESVDAATGMVRLAKPASYGFQKGDRFFFQGYLEELDSPGEWYHDRQNDTLYFQPPVDIARARVSVPRVNTIVSLARTSGGKELVHDIVFQGFILEGCDGSAVSMNYARDCAVIGCEIRNVGRGVTLSSCKTCTVYGCDVYQTGEHGVIAGSGNRNPSDPDGNRVENCYIHHTGYFSKTSSAVSFAGVGNVAAHNLIHDCPRIAIDYNGNDHIVEYNHLRHMNVETQDSGATYCLGRDWTNRGHIVRYNYVHDTLGYGRHGGDKWESPFFTFGIYLDDWSSGQHVYGNIVARSFLAGIDVHSGRDNVIENNIIYDCAREQMRYQSWPTSHKMLPDMLKKVQDWPHSARYPALARHKDPVADSTQSFNVFRRNIISYGRDGSTLYAISGLDYATTEHDYNVIWRRGSEPDASLQKMRDNGLDTHSVVADPKLRNPDRDDFTLAPDSPALKMGFQPIPFEKIGPYKDPRRASWPIVEAEGVREHPHRIERAKKSDAPRYIAAREPVPVPAEALVTLAAWAKLNPATAMVLSHAPGGASDAQPPSRAWVSYDDNILYVALWNEIKPGSALKSDHKWGANDGAEVCLQRGDGKGPIYVLQGYPDGYFQSKDDAGAPRADVERAGAAVEYLATPAADHWRTVWRIPWSAVGIKPTAGSTLRFNIGVRKTAGPSEWVCWAPTGGANFELDRAGVLVLGR